MSIASFWSNFASQSVNLATAFKRGDKRRVFDEVDGILKENGFDICFDLTEVDSRVELILSFEGDIRARCIIDCLVSAAPQLEQWTIINGRQPKPPADIRAILLHLFSVDIIKCRFSSDPHRRGMLQIYLPSDVSLSPDEFDGFANTFLWHTFGERQVMDRGIVAEVLVGRKADVPLLSLGELIEKGI